MVLILCGSSRGACSVGAMKGLLVVLILGGSSLNRPRTRCRRVRGSTVDEIFGILSCSILFYTIRLESVLYVCKQNWVTDKGFLAFSTVLKYQLASITTTENNKFSTTTGGQERRSQ